MTNFAVCVTGADESIVGNHGAFLAFRAIVVDALQFLLEQNLYRRLGPANVVYDTMRRQDCRVGPTPQTASLES
jgi:hypothetical protein